MPVLAFRRSTCDGIDIDTELLVLYRLGFSEEWMESLRKDLKGLFSLGMCSCIWWMLSSCSFYSWQDTFFQGRQN